MAPSVAVSHNASAPPAVNVLFASATGTAEDLATDLADQLSQRHATVPYLGTLDAYDLASLPRQATQGQVFLFIVATCGDGQPPRNMTTLWTFLRRADLSSTVLSALCFAVFGLGDRAYIKFNAAARRLHTRLTQLGAKPIIPIGLGDDCAEGGYDSAFTPWLHDLCDKLTLTLDVPTSNDTNEVVRHGRLFVDFLEMPSVSEHPKGKWLAGNALGDGSASFFDARLASNAVISNPTIAGADKEIRHIELDVSNCPAHSGLSTISPGDVIHIQPRNRPSAVQAFLELLSLDGNAVVSIRSSDATALNLNTPCTLRELISAHPDLSATPRRRFLRGLARFASVPAERGRLLELVSIAGASIFTQYVIRERRTVLLVLRDFPSARPPLEDLLNLLPRLRARAFSIASSSANSQNCVHVCAAMVRYITPLRFERVGVCSAFLSVARQDDVVPVRLERATSLMFDMSCPAILIAAGTGIAPFRSFVSATSADGVSRILFHGCRTRGGDDLYAEDFRAWVKEGRLEQVIYAYSREKDQPRTYVQKALQRNGLRLWLLLQNGAVVYVAGPAGGMPRGVRQAVVDIAAEHGQLEIEEAEAFVTQLETQKRLQMECW